MPKQRSASIRISNIHYLTQLMNIFDSPYPNPRFLIVNESHLTQRITFLCDIGFDRRIFLTKKKEIKLCPKRKKKCLWPWNMEVCETSKCEKIPKNVKKVRFLSHKNIKNHYTTLQSAWIAVPLCKYIIDESS